MDAVAVLEILRRKTSLRLRADMRNGVRETLRAAATLIVGGAALLACACIGVLLG